MDRKEFMNLLGFSVGSLVVASCLGACSKESGIAPSDVDFTLDLSASANSALNSNGGSVVKNGVIIGRTTAGAYIAVSAACTHEQTTVQYQANSKRFYCPNHGATFAESGSVTGGPTNRSLTQYNTELNGTSLRIYS